MGEALTCDRCLATVQAIYVQPRGIRPGRLVRARPILAGYRCLNPDCTARDGFGFGWPDTGEIAATD